MRVAIVSRCESRSLFIIRQVIKRWPEHLIICPVREPPPSESLRERIVRRLRKLARHPINVVTDRLEGVAHSFYHWYEGGVDGQITQLLQDSQAPPEVDINRVDVPWRDINSAEVEHRIREFQPDVLLVCVAPILKPNIFRIAPHGTINVHHGLVPNYRGEHTLFWPLYYHEYGQVGVTVHYIDEGIDTGQVLATGCPSLQPDDKEATVTAKAAKLAARLTCDVLAAAQWGNLSGIPQSRESGREFRHRQRTGWKELSYLVNRDLIGHRPPLLQESVKMHFARSDDDSDPDVEQGEAILADIQDLQRQVRACSGRDPATESSRLESR